MIKRLLFCVETTKSANTDYPYILVTIRYFYVESRKIVLRPIYMESKTRYNSKAVRENIRKQSGLADTSVIYCVDTDDFDTSAKTGEQLEQIRRYCDDNGYDFVFFCRDVEDVFCGSIIADTEKTAAIRKFRTAHAIEQMKPDQLERKQYQRHCSNILNVLDRYMIRKK